MSAHGGIRVIRCIVLFRESFVLSSRESTMRTLKLTLAYDGTNYVGWQRQTNGVVGAAGRRGGVRAARWRRRRRPSPAPAGPMRACTRSARSPACTSSSTSPPSAVQRALNVRLPYDIRVLGVVDAPPGFHARFHATGKSYRYRIATTPVLSPFDRWFVWHSPGPRDIARDAAAPLVTSSAVTTSRRSRRAARSVRDTVRTIDRLDGPWTPAARSSSTSTATDFCATWSAPSSARWPRSAPGCGRRFDARDVCARARSPRRRRDRAGRGPDARCRVRGTAPAVTDFAKIRRLRRPWPSPTCWPPCRRALPKRRSSDSIDFEPAAAPRGDHHGRQRPLGRERGTCRASKGIAPASMPCAIPSRRRRASASPVLTLYAFSVENWKRPDTEITRADGPAQALPARSS